MFGYQSDLFKHNLTSFVSESQREGSMYNNSKCHSISVCYFNIRYIYLRFLNLYEGWNFNSGNYLFTTDTK